MKKVLLAIGVLSLLITSCTEKEISLDKSSISLKAGTSANLGVSPSVDNCNWDTQYPNVTLTKQDESNIKVSAKYVGQTTITVKGEENNATSIVSVLPNYEYYREPLTEWGLSKNRVKILEARPIYTEEENNIIFFDDQSLHLNYIAYSFDLGVLYSSALLIPIENFNQVMNSINERYIYKSVAEEGSIYCTPNNKTIALVANQTQMIEGIEHKVIILAQYDYFFAKKNTIINNIKAQLKR